MDLKLIPILLPMLLKTKRITKVHLSIDDVSYCLIPSERILIKQNLYDLINRLGETIVTIFLLDETDDCTCSVPRRTMVGIHLPSLLNSECRSLMTSTYFRFHYYKATPDEVRSMGFATALCSHDGRTSYDLTYEEQKEVDRHNVIRKYETEYIATDVRLEWPIIPQLLRIRGGVNGLCVVFGHEWGIDTYSERLEKFVNCCNKNKIRFIG